MIHSVVKKFGLAEWKAICLTNEIHGHTGIFSIIGAKMGIRALEYFNVGVNNLKTVSYAGHQPPLSCFTDGLQISTGSTPGQGLLRVSDTIVSVPEAVFECNHQRIKISADSGIAAQMHEDITKGVKEYGLQSDAYWNYVEELAIRYWRDFDRHNIFIIEKLR